MVYLCTCPFARSESISLDWTRRGVRIEFHVERRYYNIDGRYHNHYSGYDVVEDDGFSLIRGLVDVDHAAEEQRSHRHRNLQSDGDADEDDHDGDKLFASSAGKYQLKLGGIGRK